jgi:hypothetical protein
MVIRIKRRLTAQALRDLNEKFRPIIVSGEIEQTGMLPEEDQDQQWVVGSIFRGSQEEEMARLVLTPKKTDFGMLRLLIDTINESPTED